MNRKMYLSTPVVFIGAIILSCLLLVVWVVMLIPVMIYPKLIGGFNPADKVTEMVTRRMMQSARKGTRNDQRGTSR